MLVRVSRRPPADAPPRTPPPLHARSSRGLTAAKGQVPPPCCIGERRKSWIGRKRGAESARRPPAGRPQAVCRDSCRRRRPSPLTAAPLLPAHWLSPHSSVLLQPQTALKPPAPAPDQKSLLAAMQQAALQRARPRAALLGNPWLSSSGVVGPCSAARAAAAAAAAQRARRQRAPQTLQAAAAAAASPGGSSSDGTPPAQPTAAGEGLLAF